jgi:hypothetical protein
LIFYSNTGKYKISVSVQESWQWYKKLPFLEQAGFREKSVFFPAWVKYDDFYNCSEITFVELKNEFEKHVNVETVVKHKTWRGCRLAQSGATARRTTK